MAVRPAHAVCVTGLERSFGEIGDNIRQGVLRFLGTPSIAFFGIQPHNDSWTHIRRLLPIQEVQIQTPCTGDAEFNVTVAWLHCDMRTRRADCRRSFLQMLCDLQHCESMIRAHERHRGESFATITRLRPDLFWEAAVDAPAVVDNATVYLPALDRQSGINDHMAFGGRWAMARYLTRIRHVLRAPQLAAEAGMRLPGKTTEYFLKLSLRLDQVRVRMMNDWMYCYHRQPSTWSAHHGCVGRIRCRSPCASLHCSASGIKSGECQCSNDTCATIVAHHGKTGFHRWCGGRHRMFYGTFETKRMSQGNPGTSCVDVSGRQLFHACASILDSGRVQKWQACAPACQWPLNMDGAYRSFASLEDVPRCILPPLKDVAALAVTGTCDSARTSSHAHVASHPDAGSVFPIRPLALSGPSPSCPWDLRPHARGNATSPKKSIPMRLPAPL